MKEPANQSTADLVLDYLRRQKATTNNIASHFGMALDKTRRMMIHMELDGKVRASGWYWEAVTLCSGKLWTLDSTKECPVCGAQPDEHCSRDPTYQEQNL